MSTEKEIRNIENLCTLGVLQLAPGPKHDKRAVKFIAEYCEYIV
jgi:hypothetical protein